MVSPSEAIAGFGTLLIWNYHRLLEMTNLGGPSQSRDTIDVTSHDSPDSYREFLAGPAAGGEIAIEGNLIVEDESGQVAFYTDLQSAAKRTGWIVMPMSVGASLRFESIPTAYSVTTPFEDKISVSGTILVSGKPAYYDSQSVGISGLVGIEEEEDAALVITPVVAAGTYKYACEVDPASTYVKLTVTAVGHEVYVQGVEEATGVETGEIELNSAGEDTEVFIMVFQTDKSPRLYVLTVTRPEP
jgi:predicted secreted protein